MTDRIISIRLPGFRYDRVGPVAIMVVLGFIKARWLDRHFALGLA